VRVNRFVSGPSQSRPNSHPAFEQDLPFDTCVRLLTLKRRTGEERERLLHSSLRTGLDDAHKSEMRPALHIMQTTSSLQPGRPAPDFDASITSGETIRLSNYRGRKVILYFYPKDDTPGCTVEACGLRDHYERIRELGAEVLGVSVDGAESHRRFTEKFNIPFPLVADADAKIAEAYGVYNAERKMARRVTFLIDEKGNIQRVFDPVKPDVHPREVLDALKA
jgi:peroxiredoxin Q/BCP